MAAERKGRKGFLSKFIHQETLHSAFPSAKNQRSGGDEAAPTALAQQTATPCRAPQAAPLSCLCSEGRRASSSCKIPSNPKDQ